VIRGKPRDVWEIRHVNRLPELAPQASPRDDLFVRGDAPCPERAATAIAAFLEEGAWISLDPKGVWFQSRRGEGELLDEADVARIDAAFARASTLRAALRRAT